MFLFLLPTLTFNAEWSWWQVTDAERQELETADALLKLKLAQVPPLTPQTISCQTFGVPNHKHQDAVNLLARSDGSGCLLTVGFASFFGDCPDFAPTFGAQQRTSLVTVNSVTGDGGAHLF